MKWLFNQNRKPTGKDIAVWLSGLKPSQKAQFQQYHHDMRGTLFEAIGEYMYPVTTQREAEVAYLLVHLCSGRGALPHVIEAFESLQPEQLAEARGVLSKYDWSTAPTPFVMIAGGTACGEIINEALEGHYGWALALADETERRFSGSFLEPEVLRDRGIVRLALHDYAGAIVDLERAGELRAQLERETRRSAPPMAGLAEPLEAARRLRASVEAKS